MTKDILESHLYAYRAKCLKVVDGDTLDLDIDLGMGVHNHQRVRLYGINPPETYGVKKGSPEHTAGAEATSVVVGLLFNEGSPVDLWIETHKDKKGKYGRYLAIIWLELDGEVINLNRHLVKEGLAQEKTY